MEIKNVKIFNSRIFFLPGKNKKKVKGGSGSKKKQAARPYAKEITLYQGYTNMCSGYFKVRKSNLSLYLFL